MTDFSHALHDLEAIITEDVSRALAEDIGASDLTAGLIPATATAKAGVLTRGDGVLAGAEWFSRCFTSMDPDCEIYWHAKDGEPVAAGQPLCEVVGNARALLSAERCSLNFLQTLSAIATTTRGYVDSVSGTGARIFDTRKTIPGLRAASKYAVRAGGGNNHRLGLYDGILIKENHIAAAGGIAPALRSALELIKHQVSVSTMVEIEVENMAQLRTALECGATLILLDNFSTAEMTSAVAYCDRRAELEASGGVSLKTVRRIAETGVDRISVGSLTKDIRAMDLSMRFKLH